MNRISLCSPDGRLRADIENRENQLQWSLWHDGAPVIEPSPLGLVLDGLSLGQNAALGAPVEGEIDETYAVRGHHNQARNHCRTLQIPVETDGVTWSLEARIADDGFAFRSVVAGDDQIARRVSGEVSSWTLPAHTGVWLAERPNAWKLKSYAGWFLRAGVEELPTVSSQGPIQLAPLVLELPDGTYAAISEAALRDFSGMRLRAIGESPRRGRFHRGRRGVFGRGRDRHALAGDAVCARFERAGQQRLDFGPKSGARSRRFTSIRLSSGRAVAPGVGGAATPARPPRNASSSPTPASWASSFPWWTTAGKIGPTPGPN